MVRGDEPRADVGVSAGWALGALGLGLFLAGLLAWTPFPAGVWHDDGVYLLVGRSLAEGGGLGYWGVPGDPPAAKFPPLYPLTLAGLWSVLPGVGPVTVAASLLNLGFLAAAGALFARLLHRELGWSVRWAVGLAALGWLPISLWRTAFLPFSEPLFLLLLVLGLTAACRVEGRPGDRRALLVLVVAVLAAVHVRTVGIALAAAAVGALLTSGRGRAAAGVAAGVGAGLLPWTLWSGRAAREIAPPLRDVLGPYGPWLVEQVGSAPGLYLATLHAEARDLVYRSATLLLPSPPALEPWMRDLRWWGLLLLLPALFLGLDRLWRRSRTLVLLLPVYLAVVWLWPFRDERLLAPLAPVLILTVAEGFRWSGEGAALPDGGSEESVRREGGGSGGGPGGVEPARRLARFWRGAGVAWAALFAGVSLWGMAGGWIGAGYEIRAERLAAAVRAVDDRVPPGGVVGAPELWAGLILYTDRPAVPSARFRPVRRDGPIWGTEEEQFRLWTAAGVDHLVVEGASVHAAAVGRLTEACGPGAVRWLATWEGGGLARLEWSPECRRRLVPRSG